MRIHRWKTEITNNAIKATGEQVPCAIARVVAPRLISLS